MRIEDIRAQAGEQRAALVTLLRQHHKPGEQLSVGDILLTPGAVSVVAALMQRDDVTARDFGIWLAANVEHFAGLTSERKRRGRFYRLAHVVRVAAPAAIEDTPEPVEPAPRRLRDTEAWGEREAAMRTPPVIAPDVEPVPEPEPLDPETARQLAVLELLTNARPRAGWTVERLRAAERKANRPLTARDSGRTPLMFGVADQCELAPHVFRSAPENIGVQWPQGAIQLQPFKFRF